MSEKNQKSATRSITQNKKAWHDYFVEERLEAGVELFGTEVKSMRAGTVNLKDSYCSFKDGEIFALGVHISPYEKGNVFNRDPLRPKRLLLHKKEILRLFGKSREKGFSVIPLALYFKGSRVKMEIGLCRGKKLYDKREDMAKNAAKREMERAFKGGGREY
ncbi:MAG: SsrA-binding protein SmpB [Ruminococcaceae bacterium]|nr:SsrA-binding protein SmpB [Oscillospiraceae bacterium]